MIDQMKQLRMRIDTVIEISKVSLIEIDNVIEWFIYLFNLVIILFIMRKY